MFGTSAITAITAQNTVGVEAWSPIDPALVRAQIHAVAGDLRPRATKSGMLSTAAIVRVVATALREHELFPYVLDPVFVSSSGTPLLDEEGVQWLTRELLPLASIVTPNLAEAEALTGERVSDPDTMGRAARALVDRYGARAALVTGGHLGGDDVVDVYFDGTTAPQRIRGQRIRTRHTHGTGCTLSAAITAHLALGVPLPTAVRRAIAYVRRGLRRAPGLGAGQGPLG